MRMVCRCPAAGLGVSPSAEAVAKRRYYGVSGVRTKIGMILVVFFVYSA